MTTSIKGLDYQANRPIELIIRNGIIQEIKYIDNNATMNQIIAPGLIDIQINGYKGYDFNKKALTKVEWESVCMHLLQVGVTTIYPTVITHSIDDLSAIFAENIAILDDVSLKHMIGGFHLEGPYISCLDGPRGAHSINHIKSPDWKEFCMLQEKANGKIKIITLSPEWDGATDFIKKAKESGVIVAIGHTAATTEQIIDAVNAGAILSTHLGNGAHVSLPRHPNYIWDQLADDGLWASVISDGHHLPENVLHVFNKVKQEKMILVSDSVSLAGMEPGEYTTPVGGEVILTENGRLHLKEEPSLLAGSAQNLLQGVENLVDNKLTGRFEALNKASVYPATLMGLPQKTGLHVGSPADIILLEQQQSTLHVVETYKNGIKKYGEETTWTT